MWHSKSSTWKIHDNQRCQKKTHARTYLQATEKKHTHERNRRGREIKNVQISFEDSYFTYNFRACFVLRVFLLFIFLFLFSFFSCIRHFICLWCIMYCVWHNRFHYCCRCQQSKSFDNLSSNSLLSFASPIIGRSYYCCCFRCC